MDAPEAPASRQPKEIWDVARSQLRLQMTRGTYETWVRDTTCLACEDGTFVISAANAYAKDWLSQRLRELIKRTLASIVGHTVDVTFVVQPFPLEDAADAPSRPLLQLGEEKPIEPLMEANQPEVPLEAANLNPRYTFATFIVGSANRMAHAVAVSVAERPGTAYNPLFIYGGSGLGKTHLLQAIGHMAQASRKPVLYVTSEAFTNELIGAIRTQATDSFRAKYRNIDVLLIDDVHFIAGKEQTQEEFFHTFNALHSSNRQIVLTSDRPPQAIPTLEERLRTRFGWGMIADIQPPNLETRIAILQLKAASAGYRVPDDVLALIAQRAHRNIRDLEGALTKVLVHAEVLGRPLSAAVAEDALAYLMPTQTKLSLETILEIAAGHFGVAIADLTGRSRSARIAMQRQILMYVMRDETGASLPQIGRTLGGRDHTTVMYGCEKVANDIDIDAEISRQVNELRRRLYEPTRAR